MSVVSNPLIGRAKQSMGGVTFSTWKGINVLKNKATTVANPRSDAQRVQRSAFSLGVLAFRQMPAAIRAGFKKLAVKKSEFNAFMSAVLDVAFDVSTPPTATWIPPNVLISKGTIAFAPITTSVSDRSSNSIVLTFPATAAQPGQALTDLAIVCSYNYTQNDWYGEQTTAVRSSGTASIPLPASWQVADVLWNYLGFSNPFTGESSDSDNLTDTIVP